MNWQKNIFTVGARYRVKQNFASGSSTFNADEVLIFEREEYSPYDNCFVYEFNNEGNDKKTWWLHEDKPTESWQQYFEAM